MLNRRHVTVLTGLLGVVLLTNPLSGVATARPFEAVSADSYAAPVGEDFGALTWVDAFDRLHAKMAAEYAFTAWKGIEWPALYARYAPRIAAAQTADDRTAYYLTLRDYVHELRDGHVSIDNDAQLLAAAAGGGFGLIVSRLDSGKVAATWVKPGGPADLAGIAVGSRIVRWNGVPVDAAINATSTTLAPQQPTNARREYERLRFLTRGAVGDVRTVAFTQPGKTGVRTASLTAVSDSLEGLVLTNASSILSSGWPRKLVESRMLPGNVGYVRVKLELDLPAELPGDHTGTLAAFRSAMHEFIKADVTGVIVDIRSNSGGLDQMSADILSSFYSRPSFYEYQNYLVPGTDRFEIWGTDEDTGEFANPGSGITITPGKEVFTGPVVALVNNGCVSSGEGIAMGIKRLPRGRVVGFYGTNGSFGMVGDGVRMPGDLTIGWPFGQSLNKDHVVQIDSRYGRGGVTPDVPIPMTVDNLSRHWKGVNVELEYGLAALAEMR